MHPPNLPPTSIESLFREPELYSPFEGRAAHAIYGFQCLRHQNKRYFGARLRSRILWNTERHLHFELEMTEFYTDPEKRRRGKLHYKIGFFRSLCVLSISVRLWSVPQFVQSQESKTWRKRGNDCSAHVPVFSVRNNVERTLVEAVLEIFLIRFF